MRVTLKDIEDAYERIADSIYETPLIRLRQIEEVVGCKVYAKCENMQLTHAFKIRGAMNAILKLDDENKSKGVIASSSGNHGQAVSYVAKMLGIPCVVVVPRTASEFKVEKIRGNGAEVVFCDVEERFVVSENISRERGMFLIPPFDHEDVIAGQGTIGLELIESGVDFSHVLVPTSGGGLLSGITVAMKGRGSRVSVVGVEPSRLPRYSESLRQGAVSSVPSQSTIADALVVNRPGDLPFEIVHGYDGTVVTVSDEAMVEARRLLLDECKILVEVSSAIGLGAILEGKLKFDEDDVVCLVISGGNAEV